MNAAFHDAGVEAAVPEGGGIVVQVAGQAVFVCRSNGVVHAMNNACPHAEAPLSNGRIRGGTIMCAAHGARFDLATGEPMGAAFCGALVLRAVKIEAGRLWIAV